MSAGSRGKANSSSGAGRVEPGAHLRAVLLRLGLDQVAVSKATGVSRQSVNNIINGRQPISRAMAGKLGRLTGHSSDYWLSESFAGPGKAGSAGRASPRVAGVLVNHQIMRAVKDGIIGIEPFAVKNLRAASIDLTLNDVVTIDGGGPFDIGLGKGYPLEPGCAVNAATMETIDLPLDYMGRIGIVARLCGQGIFTSCAFQIEPGFKGRLQFWLFNGGARPFLLRACDPVMGLEIVRLNATPDDMGEI